MDSTEKAIEQSNNSQIFFTSVIISVVSLVCFSIIAFPSVFSRIPYFQPKWAGLLCIIICIAIAIYAAFTFVSEKRDRIFSILQISIVILISTLYIVRINNSPFEFLTLKLSTGLICIPIALYIFYITRQILKSSISLIPLATTVVLASLTTFSLVYYFDVDNTTARDFTIEPLAYIFRIPNFIWVFASAACIGIFTTLSFRLKSMIDTLSIVCIFTLTLFQSGIILNSMSLGYWAKTLIFLIIWDFLYHPILNYLKHPTENLFSRRLFVSIVYHVALISLILFINLTRF
jgi:hypothetical protein